MTSVDLYNEKEILIKNVPSIKLIYISYECKVINILSFLFLMKKSEFCCEVLPAPSFTKRPNWSEIVVSCCKRNAEHDEEDVSNLKHDSSQLL